MPAPLTPHYRKSSQSLAPVGVEVTEPDHYHLYPAHPLPKGAVSRGFGSLASALRGQKAIRLDGFVGVLWDHFSQQLVEALAQLGVRAARIGVDQALRPRAEIEREIHPFLGGEDPLFGTRITCSLHDFFDPAALQALVPDEGFECTLLYGPGAGLADWEGPLIYVDLPKNEIQYRSRAGAVCNLFLEERLSAKPQYKRFYFVDWPLVNRHKQDLLPRVDWFVDEQNADDPAFAPATTVRTALREMSESVFRVRPWFEPGPWGGQWIKQHIPELPQDVPNYAWSFELITPENGLIFADGRHRLELSFDWLMFAHAEEVLGEHYTRFGVEFPIRFDFLDTVEGGNLSVQCHPRPEYIQREFGENFTQDECYYILDCTDDAEVYLGFQEGVDPAAFHQDLENSFANATEVDVKKFVHTEPAAKHDLFLIPNGTIHCSGEGNLVLEISATPYIFTFKMYDWLRLDLDGRPRPLNIARAFENLYFERQGDRVQEKLVSHPRLLASGQDWRQWHLPTHADHFYDVERWEFDSTVEDRTEGSPHVLMLVEGAQVGIKTFNGTERTFHFAETFVVPAAARQYRLTNLGSERAFVVKAYLKPPSSA